MENGDDIIQRIKNGIQKEKQQIDAVHHTDIDSLLSSIGLLTDIEDGKVYCHICEEQVTKRSIGRIYAEDEEIIITCDDWNCFFWGGGAQNYDDDNDDGPNTGSEKAEKIATEEEIEQFLKDKNKIVI